MAVGTPANSTGALTGGTTTATCASFTPTADSIIFAYVFGRKNTSLPAQPTISDSLTLTWTPITDVSYDPAANPRMRSRLWWAPAGASPAAMTVTGTISDSASLGLIVTFVTGIDSSVLATRFASGNSAAGDPSVTLGNAPAASSGALVFFGAAGTNNPTNPTGFTSINGGVLNADLRANMAYDITTPSAGPHAYSSSNTHTTAVIVELVDPLAVVVSTKTNTLLLGVG